MVSTYGARTRGNGHIVSATGQGQEHNLPSMLVKGDNSGTKTYYDVLAVKQDASYAEIRASYKAAILDSHPDKLVNQSDILETRDKFLDVQKAWEVLSDSKARSSYDKELLASMSEVEVVADEVGLQEMSVEAINDIKELYYQCRCGDCFSVTSLELEEIGFQLDDNGGVTRIEHATEAASASVVLPCGSCSLKIRLTVDTDC